MPSYRQEYSNFPEFHSFLSSCCDICQYDITFRSTRVRPFVCRESQRELKSLRVYDGSWKVAWEISIWEPFWRRIRENGFNSSSTGINMRFYEDLRISSKSKLRNNIWIMIIYLILFLNSEKWKMKSFVDPFFFDKLIFTFTIRIFFNLSFRFLEFSIINYSHIFFLAFVFYDMMVFLKI